MQKKKREKSVVKIAKTSYNYFVDDKAIRKITAKGKLWLKEVIEKLAEISISLSEKDKKSFVKIAIKDKSRIEETQNKDKKGNSTFLKKHLKICSSRKL